MDQMMRDPLSAAIVEACAGRGDLFTAVANYVRRDAEGIKARLAVGIHEFQQPIVASPQKASPCGHPYEPLLAHEMEPGERGSTDLCRACWAEVCEAETPEERP